MRHLVDRGKIDSDGIRHTAKVAWRGLALLQRELDAETMQRDYELPQRLVKKYELNTGRWDGEYVRYCVCGLNITNPDFTCFNEHCRAQ
jgi:hypothetical protein